MLFGLRQMRWNDIQFLCCFGSSRTYPKLIYYFSIVSDQCPGRRAMSGNKAAKFANFGKRARHDTGNEIGRIEADWQDSRLLFLSLNKQAKRKGWPKRRRRGRNRSRGQCNVSTPPIVNSMGVTGRRKGCKIFYCSWGSTRNRFWKPWSPGAPSKEIMR